MEDQNDGTSGAAIDSMQGRDACQFREKAACKQGDRALNRQKWPQRRSSTSTLYSRPSRLEPDGSNARTHRRQGLAAQGGLVLLTISFGLHSTQFCVLFGDKLSVMTASILTHDSRSSCDSSIVPRPIVGASDNNNALLSASNSRSSLDTQGQAIWLNLYAVFEVAGALSPVQSRSTQAEGRRKQAREQCRCGIV